MKATQLEQQAQFLIRAFLQEEVYHYSVKHGMIKLTTTKDGAKKIGKTLKDLSVRYNFEYHNDIKEVMANGKEALNRMVFWIVWNEPSVKALNEMKDWQEDQICSQDICCIVDSYRLTNQERNDLAETYPKCKNCIAHLN